MATTIKLKNSVTTTNTPTSLAQGEVAINITDKKVWVGNAATTPIQLLGAGGSATFGALTCTSLTNSGLTSGRVTYAGTGGLLQDSANLTFNGTTLTANDITDSSLTANRVVYATTNGNLTNSANLTFDGTTLTTVNTINVPNTFGFKNRIINGWMVIDQRNAGAAITTTGFVVDRFSSLEGTAGYTTLSVSSQQSTDTPSNFTNSIKVTVNTGQALTASRYLLGADHRIEGFNFASLGFGTAAAQSFTLSFWVKASVTGTYPVSFFNSGVNRAYLGTYTVNSANTWEQKSVTVAGDTSGTWNTGNGIGLGMQFAISAGSDSLGTAGAWSGTYKRGVSGMVDVASTTGATWFITGVQLEVGSTATSFDYRPYGTELALCQRYTYRHSAEGNVDNYAPLGQGRYYGTNTAQLYVPFKVTMRTSPSTVTQIGNIVVNDTGLNPYAITLALNETSSSGATVTGTTTSGTTAGNATTFYADNTSNAALIFSAEL